MLFYLYIFIAFLAAALAICLGAVWYCVLLAFLGAFCGMLILHLIAMLVFAAFANKENPKEKSVPLYRRFLTETAALLFKLGRVKVVVNGAEKLPAGRCLLVQNHLSAFDPIALYIAFKDRPLFFISKKENLAIPVGGGIMAGAGVLGLDRENNRQGILVMRKAAERLKEEGTVCVYPEGTRSKTGALGPFHDGCFKPALWAQAPVAAVGIEGSAEAAKNIFKKKSVITLTVLRVFPYEELAGKRTDEISALARGEMAGR